MIEARAVVGSIEKAKAKIESLGAEFKGGYSFNDLIFIKEGASLREDFIRVKVYTKNNWPTKNVMLMRKKPEWKKEGKIDKVVLKQAFDTEKEMLEFIKKDLPEFKKSLEYSRDGWQYKLGSCEIYIEDIKGFKPTIEIEAENEEELKKLFEEFGALEMLKESIPEIMKKEPGSH